jgi:hypothetical protein
MMRHHHQHNNSVVEEADEKEAQQRQRTTERDLAGTELSPLEASLAGLGCGALLASGTAGKLLRRTTIMARLPESAGFACLAGAVAGALTSTGLWQARDTARHDWDVYHHLVLPWWSLW